MVSSHRGRRNWIASAGALRFSPGVPGANGLQLLCNPLISLGRFLDTFAGFLKINQHVSAVS